MPVCILHFFAVRNPRWTLNFAKQFIVFIEPSLSFFIVGVLPLRLRLGCLSELAYFDQSGGGCKNFEDPLRLPQLAFSVKSAINLVRGRQEFISFMLSRALACLDFFRRSPCLIDFPSEGGGGCVSDPNNSIIVLTKSMPNLLSTPIPVKILLNCIIQYLLEWVDVGKSKLFCCYGMVVSTFLKF